MGRPGRDRLRRISDRQGLSPRHLRPRLLPAHRSRIEARPEVPIRSNLAERRSAVGSRGDGARSPSGSAVQGLERLARRGDPRGDHRSHQRRSKTLRPDLGRIQRRPHSASPFARGPRPIPLPRHEKGTVARRRSHASSPVSQQWRLGTLRGLSRARGAGFLPHAFRPELASLVALLRGRA